MTTSLAVVVMLVVRRHAPEGSHFNDGDRAAVVFGVLATGFAVLLGFVVFWPSPATTRPERANPSLGETRTQTQIGVLVFFCFPKHPREQELLARYHREDQAASVGR